VISGSLGDTRKRAISNFSERNARRREAAAHTQRGPDRRAVAMGSGGHLPWPALAMRRREQRSGAIRARLPGPRPTRSGGAAAPPPGV